MEQASAEYQQVLADAVGGDEMLDDQSIAWMGLARIAYERNDLRRRGRAGCAGFRTEHQRSNEPVWIPAGILLAWVAQARGDLRQAQAQLHSLLARATSRKCSARSGSPWPGWRWRQAISRPPGAGLT